MKSKGALKSVCFTWDCSTYCSLFCLSILSGRGLFKGSQVDCGDPAECSLLQRRMQSEPLCLPFNSPLLIGF